MITEPPTATSSQLATYQQLVKLIERELELAGQGATIELAAAVTATGEHLGTLVAPQTAQERALLHRARALRGRVTIETKRVRESIMRSRAATRRSRRMARTYVRRPTRRYSTDA